MATPRFLVLPVEMKPLAAPAFEEALGGELFFAGLGGGGVDRGQFGIDLGSAGRVGFLCDSGHHGPLLWAGGRINHRFHRRRNWFGKCRRGQQSKSQRQNAFHVVVSPWVTTV
jgi:hypothetical protein